MVSGRQKYRMEHKGKELLTTDFVSILTGCPYRILLRMVEQGIFCPVPLNDTSEKPTLLWQPICIQEVRVLNILRKSKISVPRMKQILRYMQEHAEESIWYFLIVHIEPGVGFNLVKQKDFALSNGENCPVGGAIIIPYQVFILPCGSS